MKTASILIRTRNEARAVGATLAAVYEQSIPPHEVFIIDSGSRDRTLEIASQYPVKVVTMSPNGWSYSRALNVGAREATGEFLVCLSAHCRPVGNEWLANLLRHFDDPTVAATWGPSYFKGPAVVGSGPIIRQEPGSYTFETRHWGLSNYNSALRRSLWLEFPFDESLPATEDRAWGAEAMARGYSIIHDPAAAVLHGRHTIRNAYRRSRAVQAGYKILFPQLQLSTRAELTRLGSQIWNKLLIHAREREVSKIIIDARRLPPLLAAYLGRMLRR